MTNNEFKTRLSNKGSLLVSFLFSIFVLLSIVVLSKDNLANNLIDSYPEKYNKFNNYFIETDVYSINGPINPEDSIFFTKDFEFFTLKNSNFSIEVNLNIERIDDEEILGDLYLGFTSFNSVLSNKNYFKIKLMDDMYQITHYGDDLLFLNKPSELNPNENINLKYYIFSDLNKIFLEIKTNTIDEIISSDYDFEFEEGISLDNFWMSISQLSNNLNLNINSLKIESISNPNISFNLN